MRPTGTILVHSIPTKEAAQEVFRALRTVHSQASKQELIGLMRQRPVRILENVSALDAAEILNFFQAHGINATFEAQDSETAEPAPATPVSQAVSPAVLRDQPGAAMNAASSETGQAIHGRKKRRGPAWWIRQSLAMGLIGFALLSALWFFKPQVIMPLLPFLPTNPRAPLAAIAATTSSALIKDVPSVFKEPPEPRLKTTPLPKITPVRQSPPSVLQVPSDQLMRAFELRHRLLPDQRFIKALSFLADTDNDEKKHCTVGELLWSENELVIPLLQNGQKKDQLHVALPLTFPGILDGLQSWMGLLEKQGYSFALSDAPVVQLPFKEALDNILQVDQRNILNALSQLDMLWRTGGPNRKLIGPALRANALLAVTLNPDPMQRADAIAAETLGLLAIERHAFPAADSLADTYIVANSLGYDNYAKSLQLPAVSEPIPTVQALLLSYLQDDLRTLQTLHDKQSSPLSSYLLARCLAGYGNPKKAAELFKALDEALPYRFPWLCEAFDINSLASSQQTTITYPLLLLNELVPDDASGGKKTIMDQYARGIVANETVIPANRSLEGSISFEAFDQLLARWQPYTEQEASGFLLDNDKARLVMRCLYEGAMEQRFLLLFRNWNVLERARTFAVNLLGSYKINRLAKLYLAKVLTNLGQNQQALTYAKQLYFDKQTKGSLATQTYDVLWELNRDMVSTSTIAGRLDSRPRNYAALGNMFLVQQNPLLADKYYQLALDGLSPKVWLLENIEQVTKSGDLFKDYVRKYPDDASLLGRIGQHFLDKKNKAGFAAALPYYERALKLLPDNYYYIMMEAWCLRELGRGNEAVTMLKDAISRYPKRDLRYTQLVCCLAKNYLQQKNGPLAVETIREQTASYMNEALITGAKAYELNGNTTAALEHFLKAAERYPDSEYSQASLAAYYWRHDQYGQAAEVVKAGSARGSFYYSWYFDEFCESFKNRPASEGLQAFSLLTTPERPDWEADKLAEVLDKKGLHQLAFDIASLRIPANPHYATSRYILLNTIGPKLDDPPDTRTPLCNLVKLDYRKDRLQNMLMQDGKYAMGLDIYQHPEKFDNNVRHAIMLNNLICWLRLDKKPAQLEKTFVEFFKQDRQSFIMLPGRFLLGLISQEEFLAAADTLNTRSMACYYVGLRKRLQGNFAEAARWYQICNETQGKVYERIWGVMEMRRWQDIGISNLAGLRKTDKPSQTVAMAQ